MKQWIVTVQLEDRYLTAQLWAEAGSPATAKAWIQRHFCDSLAFQVRDAKFIVTNVREVQT